MGASLGPPALKICPGATPASLGWMRGWIFLGLAANLSACTPGAWAVAGWALGTPRRWHLVQAEGSQPARPANEASQHPPDEHHRAPAPGTPGKAKCQSQGFQNPRSLPCSTGSRGKKKKTTAKHGLFKDFFCLSPSLAFRSIPRTPLPGCSHLRPFKGEFSSCCLRGKTPA